MNLTPLSPITNIKVLRGIDLDPSYKDTFTFSNADAQQTFFAGKAKFTFSDLSPVRLQNALRLPVTADKLYDCNYLMFQNANFDSKWFFAFITSIKFININMCEVTIEIDVMQTWYFDYTLKECYVEREHALDDSIGANLVPENLEIGEYVYGTPRRVTAATETKIIVAATFDKNLDDAQGAKRYGIYSGLYLNEFATGTEVNSFLQAVTDANKSSGIVAIYQMPGYWVDYSSSGGDMEPIDYSVKKGSDSGVISGHTVRNHKLLTYPYMYLRVTNNEGSTAVMPYEYFSSDDCNFLIYGNMGLPPTITCVPNHYKMDGQNFNEKINLSNFPQCAYNVDTYKAWLAQNGSNSAIDMLGSAMSTVASAMTGNISGAVSGGLSIASSVAKISTISEQPPQAHGTSSGDINMTLGIKTFEFTNVTIQKEFAEIIDDYFDIRGYATHLVKIPNRTGRASWNYVETKDCKISGNIGFEDMAKIRSIYDGGITFWHGDYIGDYSRSNTIV